ncbi:hypothetical protein PACTADRAFT_39645 [Pachysolen tannophilus NRRL Y-2460]|uniref:Ribonuclease P/MRP protein subunit POP5 n=1 Tax=Pachysolen tannophilus NRRL Y-2460 TaxID=669874 RepID=A0A1E4TYY3_PACTA|nr:hypothetical protein PACTADRAFT_39645 [Pachysolen tannophilus NRRL Y-2460]
MVRLKTRYILFEILYPFEASSDKVIAEPETLLSLHQPSPSSITNKLLIQAVRQSLADHFGDYGTGTAGTSLVIKYFSPRTSTGILRVSRDFYRYICASLMLIKKIDGKDVIIRVVRVSGTIKKCEMAAIKRNKDFINALKKNELGGLEAMFGSASASVSAVDEEIKNADAYITDQDIIEE